MNNVLFPSLPTLRKKATSAPTYENLINLASGQRRAARFDEASETLQRCLKIQPHNGVAYNNLAQVYTDIGKFDEAPVLFQRSLQCEEKAGVSPSMMKDTLLGFAYSIMRLGQFRYAWPIWEAARFQTSWSSFPGTFPWRGEDVSRLLVVAEGGFGDGFLFSRFLPMLLRKRIAPTLVVWDPLSDYMRYVLREFQGIQVLPMSHSFQYDEIQPFSHCTSIMSLPAYLGMESWSDIPPALNWEPPHRIEATALDWIGFCWKAEENGTQRQCRSLDMQTADRIGKELAKRCERVISLVPQGKQLYRKEDTPRVPKFVTQDAELLTDWMQTARTILKCKLVLTVDTAVFHLAASLGVKTLLLLPVRSDWKYGVGELPPWYGPNVTAFRNADPVFWNADGIIKSIEGD